MTNNLQPHIRIGNDYKIQYALLPGDPGRVEAAAKFLDQPEEVANNREYRTITGSYKGVRVFVTSTGIGGTSTGIAVEELKRIGVNVMIRIGSCGANQPGIRLGDLIIAAGAVRNDGASDAYIDRSFPAVPDTELLFHLIGAAKSLGHKYYTGIVRCHDSFYTEEEQQIDNYWSAKGILGSDMETAALFTIGRLRGVKTASILNVVVEQEGNLEGGINDYLDEKNDSKLGEEREIMTALEAIVSYNQFLIS
ncbi:nucleoside phosphorylase [Neobacillus sp. PS3-34]|uniref:nucleoside phosphorylase n=1 Tax=Neobacillus sp. PS3-34 TaxID=3070678 RepID=UPI0027DF98BF|nr:nucleoside phosphorylase [Neobacillus sp. PS3-34]WML50013.1 nucleoside phosphorylase [Neobacillus sp. PS3-34]